VTHRGCYEGGKVAIVEAALWAAPLAHMARKLVAGRDWARGPWWGLGCLTVLLECRLVVSQVSLSALRTESGPGNDGRLSGACVGLARGA
jgi:hypothetical protein